MDCQWISDEHTATEKDWQYEESKTARRDKSTGDDLHQPHPGTRVDHYRCFLPDLAGFAVYRCEGTGKGHHNKPTNVGRPVQYPKPGEISRSYKDFFKDEATVQEPLK